MSDELQRAASATAENAEKLEQAFQNAWIYPVKASPHHTTIGKKGWPESEFTPKQLAFMRAHANDEHAEWVLYNGSTNHWMHAFACTSDKARQLLNRKFIDQAKQTLNLAQQADAHLDKMMGNTGLKREVTVVAPADGPELARQGTTPFPRDDLEGSVKAKLASRRGKIDRDDKSSSDDDNWESDPDHVFQAAKVDSKAIRESHFGPEGNILGGSLVPSAPPDSPPIRKSTRLSSVAEKPGLVTGICQWVVNKALTVKPHEKLNPSPAPETPAAGPPPPAAAGPPPPPPPPPKAAGQPSPAAGQPPPAAVVAPPTPPPAAPGASVDPEITFLKEKIAQLTKDAQDMSNINTEREKEMKKVLKKNEELEAALEVQQKTVVERDGEIFGLNTELERVNELLQRAIKKSDYDHVVTLYHKEVDKIAALEKQLQDNFGSDLASKIKELEETEDELVKVDEERLNLIRMNNLLEKQFSKVKESNEEQATMIHGLTAQVDQLTLERDRLLGNAPAANVAPTRRPRSSAMSSSAPAVEPTPFSRQNSAFGSGPPVMESTLFSRQKSILGLGVPVEVPAATRQDSRKVEDTFPSRSVSQTSSMFRSLTSASNASSKLEAVQAKMLKKLLKETGQYTGEVDPAKWARFCEKYGK